MRQCYCGLHGHDSLLQFDKNRISLRCVSCGHESPGWTLADARPKLAFHGDARRHVLIHRNLIAERKIA
jgi:hypothetical protein